MFMCDGAFTPEDREIYCDCACGHHLISYQCGGQRGPGALRNLNNNVRSPRVKAIPVSHSYFVPDRIARVALFWAIGSEGIFAGLWRADTNMGIETGQCPMEPKVPSHPHTSYPST